MEEDLERLYSTKRLSELLDVSETAIRQRISRGQFPKPDLKIGRKIYWKASTINDFIKKGERNGVE